MGKYLWKEHYSLHSDNNDDTFDQFANLDFPLITKANQDFRIVGTCKGLVCLYGSDITALWNPSLQKSLILPKPYIVRNKPHAQIRPSIGFVIDPVIRTIRL